MLCHMFFDTGNILEKQACIGEPCCQFFGVFLVEIIDIQSGCIFELEQSGFLILSAKLLDLMMQQGKIISQDLLVTTHIQVPVARFQPLYQLGYEQGFFAAHIDRNYGRNGYSWPVPP